MSLINGAAPARRPCSSIQDFSRKPSPNWREFAESPLIRVAILGNGAIGIALGALLGSRSECRVSVWGRRFLSRRTLVMRARAPKRLYAIGATIAEPTLSRAVEGADVVILAIPTHIRHGLLAQIAGLLGTCKLLIAWEGTGPLCESLAALDLSDVAAIGLQRSPLLCRSSGPCGVDILGVRSRVVAAAVAPGMALGARALAARLLPFPLQFADQYACVSLSSGNPLIHPARLFHCDLARLTARGEVPGFYTDWEDSSSETLLALHAELASLRDAIGLPAQCVGTLTDIPGRSPGDITREIRTERRLARVALPLIRDGKGRLRFDLSSRFFKEDIGEGLAYILRLAAGAGVVMPAASAIHRWYRELLEE